MSLCNGEEVRLLTFRRLAVWIPVFTTARALSIWLCMSAFAYGLPSDLLFRRLAGLSLVGAAQFYMIIAFVNSHIGLVRALWRNPSTHKDAEMSGMSGWFFICAKF